MRLISGIILLCVVFEYTCQISCAQEVNKLAEQKQIDFIAKGVHYYRTTGGKCALDIERHQVLSPIIATEASKQGGPSLDDAAIRWITDNDFLHFEVTKKGNLESKVGIGQWNVIKTTLIVNHAGITRTEVIQRHDLKDSSKPYVEHTVTSAASNVSKSVIVEGLWDQCYNIDPRYYMYFVDDKPLDVLLNSKMYKHRILDTKAVVDGTPCLCVEVSMVIASQKTGFVADCWVDLKHSFIIRKVVIYADHYKNSGEADRSLFSSSETNSLLSSSGRWYLAHYQLTTPFPNGASPLPLRTDELTATIIPADSPSMKSPFVPVWPPKTKVHDMSNNQVKRVQPDGSLIPIQ